MTSQSNRLEFRIIGLSALSSLIKNSRNIDSMSCIPLPVRALARYLLTSCRDTCRRCSHNAMEQTRLRHLIRSIVGQTKVSAFYFEDVVQEVLIAAWKMSPHKRISSGWLRLVARRQYLMMLRGDARRSEREREFARREALRSPARCLSPEDYLTNRELWRYLLGPKVDIFREIPPDSIANLAKLFGIPKGTLYRRLHQLRASHGSGRVPS